MRTFLSSDVFQRKLLIEGQKWSRCDQLAGTLRWDTPVLHSRQHFAERCPAECRRHGRLALRPGGTGRVVWPERSAQGAGRLDLTLREVPASLWGWAATALARASQDRGTPSSSCHEPGSVPPRGSRATVEGKSSVWEEKSHVRGHSLGHVRKARDSGYLLVSGSE